MTGLDDLLSRSDFVSLNCDLNPTSHPPDEFAARLRR